MDTHIESPDYIVNIDTCDEEIARLEKTLDLPRSDFIPDPDEANERVQELTERLKAKAAAPPPKVDPPVTLVKPPVATPTPPAKQPVVGDTKLTGLSRAIHANTHKTKSSPAQPTKLFGIARAAEANRKLQEKRR